MKKIFFVFVFISLVATTYSQEEKKQFMRKGLLRAMGTISPGTMLVENASTISIHGNIEYYIADNISVRGDSYYFLEARGTETHVFDYNHSILSGASYHLKTKNHFDPYITFEPGISITKSPTEDALMDLNYFSGPATVNPLLSFAGGFNYYFQDWFHLFGEARYIAGKFLSNAPSPTSLSELRFSFGLGFNLNLLKKK